MRVKVVTFDHVLHKSVLEKARATPYGHKEYMRHTKAGKIVHVVAKGTKLSHHTKHWSSRQHGMAAASHRRHVYKHMTPTYYRQVGQVILGRKAGEHFMAADAHEKLQKQKRKS